MYPTFYKLFSSCFFSLRIHRGWRWIYIYVFGTRIKQSSSLYAHKFTKKKMVFFEAMHIDKIVTLKPISYMYDYQYNVLLKSQFCNVWSQRGSHSGCSLQLINTFLPLWSDCNCPSWNCISIDNILAGIILQLWYTWDFESLILMFSDM